MISWLDRVPVWMKPLDPEKHPFRPEREPKYRRMYLGYILTRNCSHCKHDFWTSTTNHWERPQYKDLTTGRVEIVNQCWYCKLPNKVDITDYMDIKGTK